MKYNPEHFIIRAGDNMDEALTEIDPKEYIKIYKERVAIDKACIAIGVETGEFVPEYYLVYHDCTQEALDRLESFEFHGKHTVLSISTLLTAFLNDAKAQHPLIDGNGNMIVMGRTADTDQYMRDRIQEIQKEQQP